MEELLPYYERELAFLRRYSRDFAERYPKIAGRLAMSGDGCDDPHVERMIESFALLSARVSKKLDDDYPEFTEALLEVLYPHYLRPFPSCSVVHFDVRGAAAQLSAPVQIPRGTFLTSRVVRKVECSFRTAYDVTFAPVRIAAATYARAVSAPSAVSLPKGATGAIALTLEYVGERGGFESLPLDRLRVYMDGEPSFVAALGDALFLHTVGAYVEGERPGVWTGLSGVPLHEVGFAEDEALIDCPARSHPAYRLLTEHFSFAEKFNFFDIDLAAVRRRLTPGVPVRRLVLHLVLKDVRSDSHAARLLEGLQAEHLRLHCTPVVNLFQQNADPIRIEHTASAYPVVADSRRAHGFDIYSIDKVHLVRETAAHEEVTEFRPFYSLHHGEEPGQAGHYWIARRNELVAQRSPGFETEISIVDTRFDPASPQTDTLSLTVTCTNRDLPSTLAFGQPDGDLSMEGNSVARAITLLRKPTPSMRLGGGRAAQWRLISMLSLNHLSLVQNGLPTLKEMLRLHDLPHSAISARQIEGVVGLDYAPATHWLAGKPFATFVRGLEIRLTLDEDAFVGTGLHRFIRVLDHFFGLYVHINSFVQLIAVSRRSGKELVRCAPRSGESILV
ncbi:type VI secretion system baseplate subunit TssF [Ralstonia pseudosolanacearum]|uniref:type VI secretion system baseplate subunit TssF n=1 Tax=Ralstonia pseudosolanacearum TaxID=1310165 RepID=UPI0007D84DC6|nr:type VI secretion system baseplate subunit TssF [Ralstonia pseudosolanacearum]MBX9428915.1 type VI secretion system baseplate subunit TssF [Ralstonia pseudosolanacearum]MDC6294602.1 type VI secretion system baseplate subunit TssF [Ralstonia pseudosolanacearum]MDD7788742.1 type VI secretion system baseplate subunit TssF [Ralstonia pseudosolanacearum]MDN3370189.1 type VI secretion system baseplate subunit TssF [Ralstonia pseudosolanacearum]OAK89400.1 type VI secretion protein [Ralstonia pseud